MIGTRRELLQVAIASVVGCATGRPAEAGNQIEIMAEEHALAAESASGFRKLLASEAFPGNLLILPAVREISLNRAYGLLRLAEAAVGLFLKAA